MLDILRKQLDVSVEQLPENASRLFHGRGHCYEGLEFLNIDWFSPVVWAVLYGDVPEDTVQDIQAVLIALAEKTPAIKAVAMQRRIAGRAQQEVVYGELPIKYGHLKMACVTN
jgi:23S rRNA (cytosine1962-C5)-methyltransferase